MNMFLTIFPYAAAYIFLSFCVALVLGRAMRSVAASEPDVEASPEPRINVVDTKPHPASGLVSAS